MSDGAVDDLVAMASLKAVKQQLRAAMKHKLKAVPHESVVSQSTASEPAA